MNALSPPRLGPGIYPGISEAAYHADCAATVSASSGALRTLLARSPLHARHGHPRLNPAWVEKPATEAMNRGTIMHALVLGTAHPHRVLDVTSYQSAAAKALRQETLDAGLIPVKAGDMEELLDVANAIRNRLILMPEVWAAMQDAITSGMSEAALIWEERGVMCRCRYDTLPAARFRASYDLKFTGLSAEPEEFGRKVTGDYAIQADLYPRAVQALRGDRPVFVFVAAETEAPFGVSLHALDPEAADLARQKVDRALDRWRFCMETGVWPGYHSLVSYHGPRPWEVTGWENRVATEEAAERAMVEAWAKKMQQVGAQ